MLQTISPDEMKRIENYAIREGLTTGEALMQCAASHVAEAALPYVSAHNARLLCICGTGNNGGDGLAAVRILLKRTQHVAATIWLMSGTLSPDAEREWNRLVQQAPQVMVICVSTTAENTPKKLPQNAKPNDAPLVTYKEPTELRIPKDTTCVIDALFGTGLSRPLRGTAAVLCGLMLKAGEQGVPIISVDIPSGLHGATGIVMGCAVRAAKTVTFHRPKEGLFLGMGPDYAGDVLVADIGLPTACDDAAGYLIAEKTDIASFFPPRRKATHKGRYGRVLIIAGSRGMAGAAAICALAALRTGAGLVSIACPNAIVNIVQQLCPCATCIPLPAGNAEAAWACIKNALGNADAIAVGCGMGTDADAKALLAHIFAWLHAHPAKPAVLDADALNWLANHASAEILNRPSAENTLKKRTEGTASRHEFSHAAFTSMQIITPHPAEAARLLGISTADVTADAPTAARLLAKRYGAAVVLKGTTDVLICEDAQGLNILGTPAMAKGGSGDALTGVLAALLACSAQNTSALSGLSLLQAGSALHGLAGIAAAEVFGERGLLATDLCDYLGRVEMDFDKGSAHR